MYIQMTEEEVRRDVRLAKHPAAQVGVLAQINDVSKKVIQRVLDGASWDEATDDATGKNGNRAYRKWTDAELAKVKKLRDAGQSSKQIAARFGVAPNTLEKAISNHREFFDGTVRTKRKAAHDAATP